ncbi:hypothetical protein QYF36_016005 [Acer negundo]|nr:hypothetical protein QYF36_016005 [Acer negundo]
MGRSRRPLFQTCGKNYEGKCHWGISGCYQYGKVRPLKRDCPELVQGGNEEKMLAFQPMPSGGKTQASVAGVRGNQLRDQPDRPRSQARVFTLTQQDAKTTLDIVTDKELRPLDCSMVVAIPTGKFLLVKSVYRDSKVIVDVVANALNRKSSNSMAHLKMIYLPLLVDLRMLRVKLEALDSGALLATFQVRPILINCIRD